MFLVCVLKDFHSKLDHMFLLIGLRAEVSEETGVTQFFTNSFCLTSGLDDEPSKKGGTWFGISTSGKIGALLNILDPTETNLRRGRGKFTKGWMSAAMALS